LIGAYPKTGFLLACALIALVLRAPSCAQAGPVPGQSVSALTQDVETTLDESYRAMYNLQFDQAFRKAEEAKSMALDDPMPWVAQASAVLFREFDRMQILRSEMFGTDERFIDGGALRWNPEARVEFENALRGAEKLAQARLARDKHDINGLFALTLTNGLQADDAALIGKKKFSALSFIKTSNGYAERLLARAPDCYDAYLATGIGKYIIGGKAAPVRWMLRLGGIKGDQEEGLKELVLADQHGRYLAPFARILLAFNDLRHKDKEGARRKLEWLHQQYPNNPLFLQEIAKLDRPSTSAGQ
jgi:hypothetical protein